MERGAATIRVRLRSGISPSAAVGGVVAARTPGASDRGNGLAGGDPAGTGLAAAVFVDTLKVCSKSGQTAFRVARRMAQVPISEHQRRRGISTAENASIMAQSLPGSLSEWLSSCQHPGFNGGPDPGGDNCPPPAQLVSSRKQVPVEFMGFAVDESAQTVPIVQRTPPPPADVRVARSTARWIRLRAGAGRPT